MVGGGEHQKSPFLSFLMYTNQAETELKWLVCFIVNQVRYILVPKIFLSIHFLNYLLRVWKSTLKSNSRVWRRKRIAVSDKELTIKNPEIAAPRTLVIQNVRLASIENGCVGTSHIFRRRSRNDDTACTSRRRTFARPGKTVPLLITWHCVSEQNHITLSEWLSNRRME